MSKHDKDRFQKELAIRFCLARAAVPFLEVQVSSSSDLSDSIEMLTDLDVVGIDTLGNGGIRRSIIDCKTTRKMSSINRAFWAAGVKEYSGCDEAFIILKNKAVHNHRIAALSVGVDLHDEKSFCALGQTVEPEFPEAKRYQSSLDCWLEQFEIYSRNPWSSELFNLARNVAPLSASPWSTFRKIIAALRAIRGEVDPEKSDHIAIYFDVLVSTFVLWATLARDIRRFYEPNLKKEEFAQIFRYYIWGGREAYELRQQIRTHVAAKSGESKSVELPAWPKLLDFAGLILAAPQCVLECAIVCRDLSMRQVTELNESFDKALKTTVAENGRIRQFTVGLSDYLVAAGGLPQDLEKKVRQILFEL